MTDDDPAAIPIESDPEMLDDRGPLPPLWLDIFLLAWLVVIPIGAILAAFGVI